MIERCTEEENSASSKQVVVVRSEPYAQNEHNLPPGEYTEKEIRIREFLPQFLQFIVPERGSMLVEKVRHLHL